MSGKRQAKAERAAHAARKTVAALRARLRRAEREAEARAFDLAAVLEDLAAVVRANGELREQLHEARARVR